MKIHGRVLKSILDKNKHVALDERGISINKLLYHLSLVHRIYAEVT